jgi:N utilization substance protein B
MGRKRSGARQRAVQALYQWELTGQDVTDIESYFLAEHDMAHADTGYFSQILHGVPKHLHELEDQIDPLLDRPISQLDPVERTILRVGAFELKFCPEIPYRVVINEAVELAKTFGAEQSHKYINSILDKVARVLRAPEVKSARP